MGISRQSLGFLDTCISECLGSVPLSSIRMLELGNQRFPTSRQPAKLYFEGKVAEHVSVDLNGKDGSLPLDLTKPELFVSWNNYFCVVTNFGCSEHVRLQYECFQVMHSCLAVHGIMVHVLPEARLRLEKGYWKHHCSFYYYSEFFEMLADRNGYKLVRSQILHKLLAVCLQKVQPLPFMEDRDEFSKYILDPAKRKALRNEQP